MKDACIKSRTCLYNPIQFFPVLDRWANMHVFPVNHVHVKRLGIASGMANAWRPGSAKFTDAPDKARRTNANPEAFPKESLQLRLWNLSSTSNSSFCYSWMVCLLGFCLRNAPLVTVEKPILDGIVFVFHLAWCIRGLHSLERFWPYLIALCFLILISWGRA